MEGVVISNKKKQVFHDAMRGKWKQVVEMFKQEEWIQNAPITRSGDTVLHIAAWEGKDDVVDQMLQHLVQTHQDNVKKVLETKNQRDNTALHIAASMGNVRMCHLIASKDPSLVDCRNVDGETPLFLAALNGQKQSFLSLHYIRNPNYPPNYANCTRSLDGDTILHSAIAGDHFDLAFQIIKLYGETLVNRVNEKGLLPLHLLAAKPSAFKSGSRLGRIETIIYHCVFVEHLKVEKAPRVHTSPKDNQAIRQYFPDNYKTFFDVISATRSAGVIIGKKRDQPPEDPENAEPNTKNSGAAGPQVEAQGYGLLPANYRTWYQFLKILYVVLLIILGKGSHHLKKIRRKKQKHTWSIQIMNELLVCACDYEYDNNGSQPERSGSELSDSSPFSAYKPQTPTEESGETESRKRICDTPILIAAQNGVTEMVKKIVELFPVAIYDMNEEKKNIVLLAVEKRQPHVYKLLMEKNIFKESLFRQVDIDGNSALHLAAKHEGYKPWLIAGAALQMQSEIKWFQFVKESMPLHFFARYNNNFQTPKDIFNETHSKMVQSGGEWLTKTAESCSVVATLVATVAFASSTTVPGDFGSSGEPNLENEPAFNVFAISSLVALCFSITSTVMFLSILTSRYQEFDFNKDLPTKLLLGLSSLFLSIASMLVSFCAGHFFVLNHRLRYDALPIYIVTSFPVTLFALAQFPLYFDLLLATFTDVPKRSYTATPAMEYPHSPNTTSSDDVNDSKHKPKND